METTVEKNHVRAVARAGPVLRAVAGVALAVFACAVLPGCNKGIDPKPTPKYLLYAGMHSSTEGWIAVIDCATDSVIDSISGGFQSGPWIVASPDGKYFADLSANPQKIFDAATRTQIKYLLSPSIDLLFLPAAGIVVCPGYDSAVVYDIPGFNLKEVWPRPRWPAAPVGSLGQFASVDPSMNSHHDKISSCLSSSTPTAAQSIRLSSARIPATLFNWDRPSPFRRTEPVSTPGFTKLSQDRILQAMT